MKKLSLVFCALLLTLLLARVGHAGTINLHIVDQAEQPIPDVTVTVNTRIMASMITTILKTNAEGRTAVSHPGLGGSSCVVISVNYTISKLNYQFNPVSGSVACGYGSTELLVRGTNLSQTSSVSAAAFKPVLTSEMITAAFGVNLATTTAHATLPLPTTLGGRSLLIADAQGVIRPALLLYVSPTQINYLTPAGLAPGVATFRLLDQNAAVINTELVEITGTAPGIFTANADGQGVPAAMIVRAQADGSQQYEPVMQFDETQRKFVPLALDLGSESELIVLALFGTGWRNTSSTSNVMVKIGGIECPVEYIGRQPTIEGLDQLNVRLPRTLIGKGDATVEVQINSVQANPVQIKIK